MHRFYTYKTAGKGAYRPSSTTLRWTSPSSSTTKSSFFCHLRAIRGHAGPKVVLAYVYAARANRPGTPPRLRRPHIATRGTILRGKLKQKERPSMAQRKTGPLSSQTIRRTLHWFWWVTKKKPFATFMAVFTSVTYTALLNYANTWVMGLIVDRVSAEPVPAAQVWEVFAPYVIALLVVNAVGQTCSKLQDWSVMQLEMNGNSSLSSLPAVMCSVPQSCATNSPFLVFLSL